MNECGTTVRDNENLIVGIVLVIKTCFFHLIDLCVSLNTIHEYIFCLLVHTK